MERNQQPLEFWEKLAREGADLRIGKILFCFQKIEHISPLKDESTFLKKRYFITPKSTTPLESKGTRFSLMSQKKQNIMIFRKFSKFRGTVLP